MLNPNHSDSLQCRRAVTTDRQKRQAVALLRQAISVALNNANIYVNLGVILGARGETAQYRRRICRSHGDQSELCRAHNNQAMPLKSLGRLKEAYAAAVRLK